MSSLAALECNVTAVPHGSTGSQLLFSRGVKSCATRHC
eukprot:CAMPEP_0181244328 /NCGR_PEP_ID=MMETSP1096-20121128/42799_1 /TAXON_ID=156174 ORGANISM="Chrysochromulina ericina, Strain CCMP281" /NCGR_SAMPLE_ID=MMETSP1096 /ASSEMBLY_ACC=CAM_ASM_000453 /LENGTH=37 /DNA_ID= /DNA_START= /DNA_END= /DNA_ORIENTATION=